MGLTIDPCQRKNKNGYYHNFKTELGGRPEFRLRSRAGLTVNPGQCKDKSGYYHSFKTQLEGRLGTRPGSQVGLTIDFSQHKDKNYYYYYYYFYYSFKTHRECLNLFIVLCILPPEYHSLEF
jgi:hypothetical protein